MKNQKCSILMLRKYIDYGICQFQPLTVLDGDWIDGCFEDSIGTRYLPIENIEVLESEDGLAVGYTIDVDELSKKYPELSLPEAKSKYLDEISENVHIGFSIDEQNKIVIRQLNLMDFSSKLNNGEIDQNFNLTLKNQDIMDNYSGDHVVVMSDEVFKNLLNKDNLEDIKLELNKIYQGNQEVVEYFDGLSEIFEIKLEEGMPGSKIITLFEKSHTLIQKETDLKSIYSILELITKFYTDLALKLNEMNVDKIDIKNEEEILNNLIDLYTSLQKFEDLNHIKTKLSQTYKTKQSLKIVSKKYDELQNHQVKLLELKEVFEQSNKQEIPFFDVKAIKKYFDQIIIGQEEAKKNIISSIIMNKLGDPDSKNACLLIGPTGSGKTLIARTVSDYFNIPMVIVDTTQLTVPGYVGSNNDGFIIQLIMKADGDVKKAENGILVFDEIDKKGTEKNDDISGRGVLNTLLPLLQGTTYKVKYNGKEIIFDTSKLTIFATGAFTNVAQRKNQTDNAYHDTKIGFNSGVTITNQDIIYPKIETDDLVKYGNMPIELMGRFSNIIQLKGHTKESLKAILTDSKESPLLAEKEKLSKINIHLDWTDDYLEAIAIKALSLKTGARSLKATIESSIQEVRWEALQNPQDYSGILMTKDSLEDCFNCYLIDQYQQKHLLKEILDNEKGYVKTRRK